MRSYHAAGEKLSKFIKHRKGDTYLNCSTKTVMLFILSVPLEEAEIKARMASVEDKIKKEFSVDFIDKENSPDPVMMKKLNHLEKNSG